MSAGSVRGSLGLRKLLLGVVALATLVMSWSAASTAHAFPWLSKLCLGFAGCNAKGLGNAGYQNVYKTSHWGMTAGHNCTNYAAYRLIARGIDASYLRGQGMAYQWGSVAHDVHHVPMDGNPRVGDIAWFSSTSGVGTSGHVAYVESVNLAAGTVRVSEDNAYGGDFDWRDYVISSVSGFIHFDGGGGSSPANREPQGSFDQAQGGPGTVSVGGWAFDRDVVPAGTSVHVYVGGPAGTPDAEGHDLGAATASRPDVGAAYPGVGDNHGFNTTFTTGKRGSQTVYLYAINQPSGNNPLIGQRTVVIGDPNPTGFFDQATSPSMGKIRVVGWGFDPNAPKQPVGMHAYVGGPAGKGEFHDLGLTGVSRLDVQAAHPETSDSQGIDATFATGLTGTQSIYLYALNLAGTPGDNILLGSRTININSTPPAPTPRVEGELATGSPLTAVTGSWPSGTTFTYQWKRDGADVAGATSPSYQLAAADADARMSVKVTGTAPGAGPVDVTSDPTAKVLTVSTPQYGGDIAIGRTVIAQPLSWTAGTSFTYQWLRDGSAIPSATSETYSPTADDESHTLGLAVTGTAAGYATITRIASTAFRVIKIGVPTIIGTARVGETIRVDPGTWTEGSSLMFGWLSDGVLIPGSHSQTYEIVEADLGKVLSTQVIGWTTGTATLGSIVIATDPVAPALTFTTAPTPTITGTARVGATLTVTSSAWKPAPDFCSAQWRRNGAVIPGATQPSYTLTSLDKGAKITVTVTSSLAGYETASRTSPATSTVAAGVIKTATPKLSGTTKVGKVLTVQPGSWQPETVAFRYQWYRDSKAIKGATKATYTVVKADKAHKLKVKVTGSLAGYTTRSITTSQTKKVA